MTKSTGALAAQRRREELLFAEMALRRVQLHLRNLNDEATAVQWRRSLVSAMEIVHVAYCAVLDEHSSGARR